MKNPFTKKFWAVLFIAAMFLLGLGASKVLPDSKFVPATEKQFPFLYTEDKKPFCSAYQEWLWDEEKGGYWNQAYCFHRLLRDKKGNPRIFSADEIAKGGKIKPSKT